MRIVSATQTYLQRERQSRKSIIFFLSLSLMTALMNSSLPTPLYPIYTQKFSLHATALSIIYGVYAAGVLVSLFMIGFLSKKVMSHRWLIFFSLSLICLAGVLFSFAESFNMLLLARFCTGLGTGGLTGAANVSLVKFGPQDGGKTAALFAVSSFTFGLSLGPILSGLALEYHFHYLTFPYLCVSGLALVSVLGIYFRWPENSEALFAGGRNVSKSNSSIRIGLSIPFCICCLSLFLCWMVAACILAIGPSISIYIMGYFNIRYFSYVVSGYLCIAGISQVLSKKIDARKSLTYGYIAQIASFILFYLAFHEKSIHMTVFGLLLAGYAYGALFVGSASLVNRISNTENHKRMVSIFYMVAYTANWVPIILGASIDSIGLFSTVADSLFIFMMVEALILGVSVKILGRIG